MKKILSISFLTVFLILFIASCGGKGQTESKEKDVIDLKPETEDTLKLKDAAAADNQEQSSSPMYEIHAQNVVRSNGATFSVVDPFHGHRTNQIPLYKTEINLSMNDDGTVEAQRIRVQYGWSSNGFIMDSVVYNDKYKGKWLEKERLTSSKEKVYQIILDNTGYVWYWPENGNRIFARSGDNWEAMINNETNKAYPVINYNKK